MTANQLATLLRTHGACQDARDWARGKDLATAWQDCPRADWLLWLAARMIGRPGWPSHQDVVLAACACAETTLPYVPAGETRPATAIATAQAWARGTATLQQTRDAAKAALASAFAASAYAASAAAVYAASATGAAEAAVYAVAAADATVGGGGSADAYDSRLANAHARLADLVRSQLTIPI